MTNGGALDGICTTAPDKALPPPEHELAIFRVAQEALTNVHRHSKSPSVAIRLFEQDGAAILEVDDAGHGILA